MIVTCDQIMNATCAAYQLPQHLVYSRRRMHELTEPRHVSWHLARELTPRSLPEIGRRMGGYDHTTVLNGCRRISARARADEKLAERLVNLRNSILVEAELTDECQWSAPPPTLMEQVLVSATKAGEPDAYSPAGARALCLALMHYYTRCRTLERTTAELQNHVLALDEKLALQPYEAALDYERLAVARRVATSWQTYQLHRHTPFEKADQTALEEALKALSPLYAKTGENA